MPARADVHIGRFTSKISFHDPPLLRLVSSLYSLLSPADSKLYRLSHSCAAGAEKEYVGYMCHNLHLLVYAAMHDGQFQTALTAAHELLKLIYCSGKVAQRT